MIPRFDISLPEKLDEALELLESGDSLPVCGGTDLLVLLRAGKIKAERLVYIGRIPELHVIEDRDDSIYVGAACRFEEIEKNECIKKNAPLLAAAAGQVGSPAVRNRGTIGGNVQNASPAGDGLVALYGEKAVVVKVSRSGEEQIPIQDFVLGPRKTLLKPGELIKGFLISKKEAGFRKFFKIGRRNALAISVVNGCVCAKCDGQTLYDIQVVLGAVGITPVIIDGVNEKISRMPYNHETDESVQEIIEKSISPIDDIRAGKEYRRYIAGISVRRALREAADWR